MKPKFKWTKQKRQCLELYIAGMNQVAIARELGFHRNTVGNWLNHPIFLAELKLKLEQRKVSGKLRRLNTSLLFRQRLERLASSTLGALEKEVEDSKGASTTKLRAARELLAEYRLSTNEERTETGEAEKRIHHIEEHRGDLEHQPLTAKSFKDALLEAARAGVIDVKAIMSSATPEASLRAAVQQVLAGDEKLIDSLHRTDEPVLEDKK